jgi:hypothetical protein
MNKKGFRIYSSLIHIQVKIPWNTGSLSEAMYLMSNLISIEKYCSMKTWDTNRLWLFYESNLSDYLWILIQFEYFYLFMVIIVGMLIRSNK